MFTPDFPPVRGFDTNQIAIRTEREQELAIHRWRRTRGGVTRILFRVADLAQLRRPNPAAVLHRERDDRSTFQPFVAEQINSLADHRRRGESRADIVHLPEQFRSVLRPFLKQPGVARVAVALRSAPLWEVCAPQ